jgi:two-component system, NarL family, response regulator LiaR
MRQSVIRVLIADDHDLLRNGLSMFLNNCSDIELVGEATNGQEAVEKCRHLQPDVVLMDMMMPVLDGISATRYILQELPDTRVIALTSYDEESMVEAALQAGAISYLIKNITTDELADAIRAAYLGESTLSQEATQALIGVSRRPPQNSYQLTERELDVLELMIKGRTNADIAEDLVISRSTVKKHVHNILNKLGTTNRTEAVALAIQSSLVKL